MKLKINKDGVCLTDIFWVNYYGINVFLTVDDTMKDKVAVHELETYKYKNDHAILKKWREKHEGFRPSRTGWVEMIKANFRSRKPANCVLSPIRKPNNTFKQSLVLKTGYKNGKPILYVPVNDKSVLYWKAKKIRGYVEPALIEAKCISRYGDEHGEKRKALYTFYPYIPEIRTFQEKSVEA